MAYLYMDRPSSYQKPGADIPVTVITGKYLDYFRTVNKPVEKGSSAQLFPIGEPIRYGDVFHDKHLREELMFSQATHYSLNPEDPDEIQLYKDVNLVNNPLKNSLFRLMQGMRRVAWVFTAKETLADSQLQQSMRFNPEPAQVRTGGYNMTVEDKRRIDYLNSIPYERNRALHQEDLSIGEQLSEAVRRGWQRIKRAFEPSPPISVPA